MVIKIQCPCGVKYSFEVSPETTPVRFVCQECGVDNSEAVNQLIQEQLGTGVPGAVAPQARPRLHIEVPKPAGQAATSAAAPGTGSPIPAEPERPSPCLKHAGQEVIAQCLVCQKPLCPKCMELFGYVCSAYCQAQAEKLRMTLPVYEGQKGLVEAAYWKKARWIAAAALILVSLLLGGWGWYAWFGSYPKVIFSLKLPESDQQSDCRLITPTEGLLRHGNQLSRYDFKKGKQVWSTQLFEKQPLGALDDLAPYFKWHVDGKDIWLVLPNKVVQFNWQTGKPEKEIPVPKKIQLFEAHREALFLISQNEAGGQILTRISLPGGDARSEQPPKPSTIAKATQGPTTAAKVTATTRSIGVKAAQTAARRPPTEPLKASSVNQEMDDEDNQGVAAPDFLDASRTESIFAGENIARFSVRLLEKKIVQYDAIKESATSELEKGVTAANAQAAINEIVNEWQRDRTGGKREEDVSRYQVGIERMMGSSSAAWSGEVAGPPDLFPLATVDVLVAGRTLVVFDKANQKLWESKLAYPIARHFDMERPRWQLEQLLVFTPCVEREQRLYVCDQGVLTAFALNSGTVQWRLPSVGIYQVQFDEQGMMYVASTTAGADTLRYSQQIDTAKKTSAVLLKVNPSTGKILWRVQNRGHTYRLSGKFLYGIESDPGNSAPMGLGGMPAHVRIYRLDPANGRDLWEYYEKRAPLAFDFHQNTFQLLFRNELEVLRFLTF